MTTSTKGNPAARQSGVVGPSPFLSVGTARPAAHAARRTSRAKPSSPTSICSSSASSAQPISDGDDVLAPTTSILLEHGQQSSSFFCCKRLTEVVWPHTKKHFSWLTQKSGAAPAAKG